MAELKLPKSLLDDEDEDLKEEEDEINGKRVEDPYASSVLLPFDKKRAALAKERFRRKREFMAEHYKYALPHLTEFLEETEAKRAEDENKARSVAAAEAAARERDRRKESALDDELLELALGRIGKAGQASRLASAQEVALRIQQQEKRTEERKQREVLLKKLTEGRGINFGDSDLRAVEAKRAKQLEHRAAEREKLKAAELAAANKKNAEDEEEKVQVAQSMLDMPWLPPNPAMARLKRFTMLYEHGATRYCLWGEAAKLRNVGSAMSLYFEFLMLGIISLALMAVVTFPTIVLSSLGDRIVPTQLDLLGFSRTSVANLGQQDSDVRAALSAVESNTTVDAFGNETSVEQTCRLGQGENMFWGPYDVLFGGDPDSAVGVVPITMLIVVMDAVASLIFVVLFAERYSQAVKKVDKTSRVDEKLHAGHYSVDVRGLPSDVTEEEVREHFSTLYDPTGPDWQHFLFHPKQRQSLSLSPWQDAGLDTKSMPPEVKAPKVSSDSATPDGDGGAGVTRTKSESLAVSNAAKRKGVFRVGRGLKAKSEAMDAMLKSRGGLNPCVPVIETVHNENPTYQGSWVADVVLIRNQNQLLAHEKRLTDIRAQLKRARDLVDKYSPTSPWRNSLEYSKSQEDLRRLLMEYSQLREEAPDVANVDGPVRAAIVTFQMEESRARALEDYKPFSLCPCLLPCQPRALRFARSNKSWGISVETVPDPTTMIFENLHLPRWHEVVRKIVASVIVLLLVVMSVAATFASDDASKDFTPTSSALLLCNEVLPFSALWGYRPNEASGAVQRPGDPQLTWLDWRDNTLCFADNDGLLFMDVQATQSSFAEAKAVLLEAGRNLTEFGVSAVRSGEIAYPDACHGACIHPIVGAMVVGEGEITVEGEDSEKVGSGTRCPVLIPPWVLRPAEATWPEDYGAEEMMACMCMQALSQSIRDLGPSVGPTQLSTGPAAPYCSATVQRATGGKSLAILGAFVVTIVNLALLYVIRFLGTFLRLRSEAETRDVITSTLVLSQLLNTVGAVVLSSTGVLDTIVNPDAPPADGNTLAFDVPWHSRVAAVIVLVAMFANITPNLVLLSVHYLIKPLQRRLALTYVTSQRELEVWYEAPPFPLEERYVAQLTFLFSIMIFSGGFPLLLMIGAMGFAISYWVDRWVVIRLVAHPTSSDTRLGRAMLFFLPLLIGLKYFVSFWTFSDARVLYSPVMVGRDQPLCWDAVSLAQDLADAGSPFTRVRRLAAFPTLISAALALLYALQRRGRVHLLIPCVRRKIPRSKIWSETHIEYEKRNDEELNPPYSEYYSRVIIQANYKLDGSERRNGWRLVRSTMDPPGVQRRIKIFNESVKINDVERIANAPMRTWEVFAERGEWSYALKLHQAHGTAARAIRKAEKRNAKQKKKKPSTNPNLTTTTTTKKKKKTKALEDDASSEDMAKGVLRGNAKSAAIPGSTSGAVGALLPSNTAVSDALPPPRDIDGEDEEARNHIPIPEHGLLGPIAKSFHEHPLKEVPGAGGVRPPPDAVIAPDHSPIIDDSGHN